MQNRLTTIARRSLVNCTFLLALVGVSEPVAAQNSAPDTRIIVIDVPYFSEISEGTERGRAIDDMLADIRMFEHSDPARKTIVLIPRLTNIRELAETDQGTDLAAILVSTSTFAAMRAGRESQTDFLNVEDVKAAIFRLLRSLRSSGTRGRDHVLDLHVFAPGWRLPRAGNAGDLMGHEQATVCVIERGTKYRIWPEDFVLRVEFRLPEGISRPSASAEAAFIGVLTGFPTAQSNIMTRGSTGPLCEMDSGVRAMPYINANMVDSPDCQVDIEPILRTPERVTACRSMAPTAQSIGNGLDRRPLALVARMQDTRLHQPQLGGSFLSQVEGRAIVGGVELAIAPLGKALAHFVLRPGPNCRPDQGGKLILGQGAEAVVAQIARYYCEDSELPFGEVTLQ